MAIMPPKPLLAAFGLIVVLIGVSRWQHPPSVESIDHFGPTFDLAPLTATDPSSFMPIIISLVLLSAALWVILSRSYQPTDRHWAYGAIGTIVGFWLRS